MRLLRGTAIFPVASLLLFATILGRNSADAFGPLLWRRKLEHSLLPLSVANKAKVRPQWEREKDVQCGTSHYQPPMPSHNFSDNDSRRFNIINGHRVPSATDLPWMATLWGPFLHSDDNPTCSATIIGRQHVLVAGHCLWFFYLFHGHGNRNWPPMDTSAFTVRAGVTDYSDRTAIKVVSRRIIPHPNATIHLWPLPEETSDDLAIIELSEPLNFTQTVQPICLHAYNQSGPWNTTVATMAGFGLLDREWADCDSLEFNFGVKLWPKISRLFKNLKDHNLAICWCQLSTNDRQKHAKMMGQATAHLDREMEISSKLE